MLQTERDVEELVLDFYRSPEKYPGQRLGQTLINNCPLNIVDSEIFYCEDPDKALKLFMERYTAASDNCISFWNKACAGRPAVDVEAAIKKIQKLQFVEAGNSVVCILTTRSGFVLESISSAFHESRYSFAVGKSLALKSAVSKLMEFESYWAKETFYLKPLQEKVDDYPRTTS